MPSRLVGVIALVVAGAIGCSDGSTSQPAARDRAATAACEAAQRCGQIGSGQTYVSLDDCLTKRKNDFQNAWPPETCNGKINETQLDTCVNAIQMIQCGNILQLADIVLNQCPSSQVCNGM